MLKYKDKKIQRIIKDNEIIEYCTLLDFFITLEDTTLWNVASSHTLFLNTYITSKRHKNYKIICYTCIRLGEGI